MKYFVDLEEDGTVMWWAVCSLDNKTFYGVGGLNSLSKGHKTAEIGLWLLKEFWGKGIMTEAMLIICNCGFDKLGPHRIEGLVQIDNLNCKTQ